MTATRTALVTGAAVRIGRTICEALARSGFNIVLHCRNSVTEARAAQTALEQHGAKVWIVRGPLDSEKSVSKIWRDATKAAGKIDLLVNSAALFNKDTVSTLDGKKLLTEFWPNLFAPILLTKHFATQKIDRGHIINLLDRRITSHDTTCVPYLLTKKALAEFTQTSAIALAPCIRVNAIAPGPVLPPPGKPMSHLRDKAGKIPLGKTVTPEQIADAVLMLDSMTSTTGQIVFVDGGQHLLG